VQLRWVGLPLVASEQLVGENEPEPLLVKLTPPCGAEDVPAFPASATVTVHDVAEPTATDVGLQLYVVVVFRFSVSVPLPVGFVGLPPDAVTVKFVDCAAVVVVAFVVRVNVDACKLSEPAKATIAGENDPVTPVGRAPMLRVVLKLPPPVPSRPTVTT
jgi:hypothetical protein